jgi:toxin ParE1/3/4
VQVLFTPSARIEFLSAIKVIRRNNPTVARRFRQQVEKTLKRLARFPRSGALIPEFPEVPHREIYIKPYRFFYLVREDNVWIVALWHGAQIPVEPEGS